MTTAERMKLRRKELGLSAEYVADRLGCSPATVYRYEKGDIEKMPIDILNPLASILKTTVSDLMGLSVHWEDDLYSDFWKSDDFSRIQILKINGIPESLLSEANRLGLNTKPLVDQDEGFSQSDYDLLRAIKNADEKDLRTIRVILGIE